MCEWQRWIFSGIVTTLVLTIAVAAIFPVPQ